MKFAQIFFGVPDGAIYPVEYQPGDDCPPELLAAAQQLGVLNLETAPETAPEEKPPAVKRSGKPHADQHP